MALLYLKNTKKWNRTENICEKQKILHYTLKKLDLYFSIFLLDCLRFYIRSQVIFMIEERLRLNFRFALFFDESYVLTQVVNRVFKNVLSNDRMLDT